LKSTKLKTYESLNSAKSTICHEGIFQQNLTFLTLRHIFLIEPQAPFWVDLAHHFSTTNFTTKEWFYPKNNTDINYPEFSSDFFKGTYNVPS